MTKSWRHEVSVDWLQARRDVLTASEIKAMLPEYKRMLKKPGTMSPGFFALCGAKLSSDIPDPVSVGSAARGHIMEPYAVDDWNKNHPGKPFFHWDNLVIKRNGIGYSPDALDIKQYEDMGVELWWEDGTLYNPDNNVIFGTPTKALEVKCYEPANHMKTFLTSKENKEERFQIAVAFMALPSIKTVEILWYCPEAPIPMYNEIYMRSQLKEEIKIITDMVKMFHKHMEEVKNTFSTGMQPHYSTEQIYKEYLASQEGGLLKIR